MNECSPVQLHHLFVFAVLTSFLSLTLLTLLIGLWRYVRLGRWAATYCGDIKRTRLCVLAGDSLMKECGDDYATVFAEIHEIEGKNIKYERLMREGMEKAFTNGGEK